MWYTCLSKQNTKPCKIDMKNDIRSVLLINKKFDCCEYNDSVIEAFQNYGYTDTYFLDYYDLFIS